MHNHYLKGFVSVLASPGGVGKTSLQVVEALAIASGRPLLGEDVRERTNVWIINLEDPMEEMQLRVAAAMRAYGVTKKEIEGRLFVDAGRDFQLLFATQGAHGITLNTELTELMINKIRENDIGMVFITVRSSLQDGHQSDRFGTSHMCQKGTLKPPRE